MEGEREREGDRQGGRERETGGRERERRRRERGGRERERVIYVKVTYRLHKLRKRKHEGET